jgi:2-hydroxy-6-oxonona-2,4-dienedioate hydrolase
MTIWTDLNTTEFSLRYVNAGGIRTRSLTAGSGEPIVFLPGTSGHLDSFSQNVAAHAAHFEVHVIDQLGHGYTDKPDYDYTIDRYVEHVLAYLDAIGATTAILAGQSLGGWVAAWLASEHQERVSKLSLIAPGGTVANPEMMTKIRTTTKAAADSTDREMTRKRLEWLMHDPQNLVTEELVDVRHAIYQQPEMSASLEHLLILQNPEVREKFLMREDRLARITAPSLVVWTSDNPTGNIDEGNFWHRHIPGSKMVIIDGAGHWPHYEKREEFNRVHLDFLLS